MVRHIRNAATSAWGRPSYHNQCRLQAENEDSQYFRRLRQLANDGLVLIAEGHAFVPTDEGVDVRSRGVWALVPCIDNHNRPYLTVSEVGHQCCDMPPGHSQTIQKPAQQESCDASELVTVIVSHAGCSSCGPHFSCTCTMKFRSNYQSTGRVQVLPCTTESHADMPQMYAEAVHAILYVVLYLFLTLIY